MNGKEEVILTRKTLGTLQNLTALQKMKAATQQIENSDAQMLQRYVNTDCGGHVLFGSFA